MAGDDFPASCLQCSSVALLFSRGRRRPRCRRWRGLGRASESKSGGRSADAQSLSLLKLLFGNSFAQRLPGHAQYCQDEAARNIGAVVGVLIVDHVAAGSPERVSSADDAWRFTLELEQHLAVNRVTECRAARKAMWRVTRGARWMGDENRHQMGTLRN